MSRKVERWLSGASGLTPVPMRNFVKHWFLSFIVLPRAVLGAAPNPSAEPEREEKERAG